MSLNAPVVEEATSLDEEASEVDSPSSMGCSTHRLLSRLVSITDSFELVSVVAVEDVFACSSFSRAFSALCAARSASSSSNLQ